MRAKPKILYSHQQLVTVLLFQVFLPFQLIEGNRILLNRAFKSQYKMPRAENIIDNLLGCFWLVGRRKQDLRRNILIPNSFCKKNNILP